MRQVFLDTVGLLAIWDESDPWHTAAERAWNEILAARANLITTSYVLLECGNAVARSPFRAVVDELRRRVEISRTLHHPTEADWIEAWKHYVGRDAGGAGIVDQVSFEVMRRLDITDAFTNDRHFKAAGFNPLF